MSPKGKNTLKIGVLIILAFLTVSLAKNIIFKNQNNSSGCALAFDWLSKSSRLEKLTTLDKVLHYLKEKYVEPSKIDPDRMLVDALAELESQIPEVLVKNKKNGFLEIQTSDKKIKLGKKTKNLNELKEKLIKALLFIDKHKTTEVTPAELETIAISGILSNFDPHSIILTPDLYNETQVSTKGSFGGLGIIISIRKGKLTVIAPIDDTPAYNAGLKASDWIQKIEDESTINMTLTEAVKRMRGKQGTPCNITVMRDSFTEAKKFKIIRAKIVVQSVEAQLLDDGVGYIRIKNFQSNTHRDVYQEIKNLESRSNGLKGIVLDLRSNPGGLLEQSIAVSDIFLKKGTIVSTVGFGRKLKESEQARDQEVEPQVPIAVLVDGGSASASEIVAGALKNNNRAVIIGRQTFGKGSVQTIYQLPEGYALKLTIAEYLTPGDQSIQSYGIVPDIRLIPVTIDKDYMNIFRSEKRVREEDLEQHIEKENTNKEKPSFQIKYLLKDKTNQDEESEEIPPPETKEEKFKRVKSDFEVRMAKELLLSTSFLDRSLILKDANRTVKKIKDRENEKIKTALGKIGIIWDEPEKVATAKEKCSPPVAKMELGFQKDKKSKDEIGISVTINNPGSCTLYRTFAMSESDYPYFSNREIIFGKIGPNESVKRTVNIKLPQVTKDREIALTMKFDESFGNMPASVSDTFTVKGFEKPVFATNYQVIDDGTHESKGNGDGMLELGETAAIIFSIKNIGKGPSVENIATLKNLSGSGVVLKKGRQEIGTLNPSQTKTVEFLFSLLDYYKKDDVEFEISAFDMTFREFFQDKLKFKVSKAWESPIKISERVTPIKSQVDLYGSPNKNFPIIASLRKDGIFTADRTLGDYYRLVFPDKNIGWVFQNTVKPTKEKTNEKTQNFKKEIMGKVPPVVKIYDKNLSLSTHDKNIKLTGEFLDDTGFKDFYVLVNNEKVYYKNLASSAVTQNKELFELNVELKDGPNELTVIVRDRDNLTGADRYFITKKTKEKKLSQISTRIFRENF